MTKIAQIAFEPVTRYTGGEYGSEVESYIDSRMWILLDDGSLYYKEKDKLVVANEVIDLLMKKRVLHFGG